MGGKRIQEEMGYSEIAGTTLKKKGQKPVGRSVCIMGSNLTKAGRDAESEW
jgi:hypothetical protein